METGLTLENPKGSEPPTEHFALIGQIVVECSHIEALTQNLIIFLGGLPVTETVCLTQHMPLAFRLQAIESMVSYPNRDLNEIAIKEIHAVTKKIKKLSEDRNTLVHNSWSISSESGRMTTLDVAARSTYKAQIKQHTLESLQELLSRACDIHLALDKCISGLVVLPELEED